MSDSSPPIHFFSNQDDNTFMSLHDSPNVLDKTIYNSTNTSPAEDSIEATNSSETTPRRSSRVRAPLAWLNDYICPMPPHSVTATNRTLPSDSSTQSHSFHSSSTPYPLLTFSHLAHLSVNYVFSLFSVLQHPDPSHYTQAKQYLEWV